MAGSDLERDAALKAPDAHAPESAPPAQPSPPSADSNGQSAASAAQSPQPAESARHFGLRRSDQIASITLITLACVLLCVHWYRLGRGGLDPVEIERAGPQPYHFQLDVNAATWVEWMQLEGIGEALARRIVADREQKGPFISVDDVTRVPGIGPKTLEQIRPWLTHSVTEAPSTNDQSTK